MFKHIHCLTATAAALVIAANATAEPAATKATTPDATAKALMAAIEKNQPDAAFALLPSSYQKDVNSLVKEFATRMDKDLWDGARQRIGRVGKALTSKQAIIIEAAKANPALAEADLETALPGVCSFLTTLSTSSFTDLEQLKKGDMASLLSSDGRKLMTAMSKSAESAGDDSPWAVAKNGKVELVSSDDTTATLKFTSGEETEELEMTKVEGVWIPAEMASEWGDTIAEAKEGIKSIDFTSEEGQAMKMQAQMMFGMADGLIAQLEAAKTAEEMSAFINGLMGQVMGMMMGGMQMQ